MTFDITTVRPTESGWDTLVDLFSDYRAHYGRQRELQRCDRWLQEQVDAGRFRCYLARTWEGKPAGMATAAVSPASLSLSLFWALRDLFVTPEHRRGGVGRALVDAVAADARAGGAV
ncbi:MAG: GNAT family N-acetyltransferase, partial [Spirochaetaceae bacterium]|nr:GNAT family N-acetyltransferase [Spirochaetaceae bacterium]